MITRWLGRVRFEDALALQEGAGQPRAEKAATAGDEDVHAREDSVSPSQPD